jgi:hypothetical protein
VSAVKKLAKGLGRFVKRYWKQILIAAAIVFTAGVATVGVAGFSSAAAAAGGGVGGFLSAAGSTMVAGVASIGGTLGIGSGVTAATAGGAFAGAPALAGLSAGAGLTLGTGAAAQGLGFAAKGGAAAAGTAGKAGGITIGGGASAGIGAGAGTGAAGAASAAGGWLSKPATGMLLQAGMGLIGNYMQARRDEELWEREKPKGFFGVGLNGVEDFKGPLPGAPRDAQGNIAPMWTNAPPVTPPNAPEFSGNAALDSGYRQQPDTNSFLDPEFDPTAAHIGGRRG